MFYELINSLTPAQRAELRDHKINGKLIWNWRHRVSYPTLMQTIDLADVTGVPYPQLHAEIAYLRADEPERERVARIVGWRVENRS